MTSFLKKKGAGGHLSLTTSLNTFGLINYLFFTETVVEGLFFGVLSPLRAGEYG
jgi:hypothetical protein